MWHLKNIIQILKSLSGVDCFESYARKAQSSKLFDVYKRSRKRIKNYSRLGWMRQPNVKITGYPVETWLNREHNISSKYSWINRMSKLVGKVWLVKVEVNLQLYWVRRANIPYKSGHWFRLWLKIRCDPLNDDYSSRG